jgi:hypothetical protein
MTTATQRLERMSVLTFLFLPTMNLYLPSQAQALPAKTLQATPTAEALLPLRSQTTASEDMLKAKIFDSAQSITAQQVSPDQPLPTDPSQPTDRSQPTGQQPPTDSQPPTDPKPEAQKKPRRINYVGIGGNIGLNSDGGTALGRGGFTVLNRNSLTDNLSIHSSSVFGDKSIQTLTLTGGAPIKNNATGKTIAFPFVGAGISIETNDDFKIDPMVTAGVDIPLTKYLTGTMRVNASFDDRTDVGVVMGVGVDLFGLLFKRK